MYSFPFLCFLCTLFKNSFLLDLTTENNKVVQPKFGHKALIRNFISRLFVEAVGMLQ